MTLHVEHERASQRSRDMASSREIVWKRIHYSHVSPVFEILTPFLHSQNVILSQGRFTTTPIPIKSSPGSLTWTSTSAGHDLQYEGHGACAKVTVIKKKNVMINFRTFTAILWSFGRDESDVNSELARMISNITKGCHLELNRLEALCVVLSIKPVFYLVFCCWYRVVCLSLCMRELVGVMSWPTFNQICRIDP